MNIVLKGKEFVVIDSKEMITIADSFVVRRNKIGSGNGEAKLYVGNENNETRKFFGNHGFSNSCVLLKSDLLKYLDETKTEYLNPEQPYIHKDFLPNLWKERRSLIEKLEDYIEFKVSEQTQISGPRIYVKSEDEPYNIIRELSLPNITYISILKLLNSNAEVLFYYRLFADYFGNNEHPYLIEKEESRIENSQIGREQKFQLIKARYGQGKYREKLLEQCPYCPITMVSDDRLLIAGHIKPWSKSDDAEKIDPQNGFMFTPTIDWLFDKGFISFSDDKRILLSPFLSNMTYSKLGLVDNKIITHLPMHGREKYLEYHRNIILKK
jgi:putative restriction endonuclease